MANHGKIEEAIRARFPDAEIVDARQDLAGIVETVRRVIDEPGFDPAGNAL
jgi:hypothetical protein